ncbi:MAG TPA: hypothetical protein VN577_11450 [Terriglobales bacterium]|nr:hypothetical protein [Terriglobales bacterium]
MARTFGRRSIIFRFPEIAERIWQKYYIAGGKGRTTPYKPLAMHAKDTCVETTELASVANFVEV